jgi:hypothetical protein
MREVVAKRITEMAQPGVQDRKTLSVAQLKAYLHPYIGDDTSLPSVQKENNKHSPYLPRPFLDNGSVFEPISRRTSFPDPYPASLQPYQDRNKRDGLGSPEQNSSRHIKAECSERINRCYCRLEPNSETFSNFFRTALRLPAGIAAVSHVLPPASAAAEERPRDMCIHASVVAAGYRPDTAPQDAEWGERLFHLTDPDGHELSFAWPLR